MCDTINGHIHLTNIYLKGKLSKILSIARPM